MSNYIDQFQGRFIGIMQWDDCHQLLQTLTDNPNDWYLYDTDSNDVPASTISADDMIKTIGEIKKTLDVEHQERYCGIVYADDLKAPKFVKIFHPNKLGKTCGSSEQPPSPKWLISKTKPVDIFENSEAKKQEDFVSKFLKL